METNDKLLKDFFSENKQEVQDNGFSQRVMQKIPEQTERGWIVWVFACIGLILTVALAIYTGLIQTMFIRFEQIPIYYLLAGIFCFPLIGSIGMYFTQNKNFKVI